MDVALHLVLMIVPIGCFVLALRFTRSLPADDPLVLKGATGAKRSPNLGLSVGGYTLLAAGFIAALALPSPSEAILAFSLSMPALALLVRAHAVRRMAARGLLVTLFAGLLYLHPVLCFTLRQPAGLAQAIAQWVGCLAGVFFIGFQLAGPPTPSPWYRAFTVLFFGYFLIMGIGTAWRTTHYTMPDRLDRLFTNYVEGFDASPRHMTQWKEVGRVAAYLTSQGAPADLSIPRQAVKDALQTPKKIWPYSWRGAIAAGALGSREYAQLLSTQEEGWRKERVHPHGGTYLISDETWCELVVLLEAGDLTQEERSAVASALARSWPRRHGYGSLAESHRICDLLIRLGRKDLIEAERPALLAMLQRSWCDKAPRYGTPGGFAPYDRTTDVEPLSKPDAPTPEANLDALDLMDWIGVPTGIDPTRMATHAQIELHRHSRRSFVVLGRGDLLNALTLQRVRRTYDTSLPLLTMVGHVGYLLAVLLPLMFVLVVIHRAPSVEIIEKQALRKRAGHSPYDKPPARKPAV